MSEHVSVERMHEALDGLLSAAEQGRMERHVQECAPCRNEYARLSEVVSALRALPTSARTPDGTWEAIAARIEGAPEREAAGATIVALPVARAGRGNASILTSRLVLSVPQLAAAAALVALLSAATVWFALDGTRGSAFEGMPTRAEVLPGAATRAVSLEGSRYLEVVDQLEEILAAGRGTLAPETLATIEESLRTVDAAIEDVRGALEEDPNSDLLLRMLANHQRTKLSVLQRAAAAVQVRT